MFYSMSGAAIFLILLFILVFVAVIGYYFYKRSPTRFIMKGSILDQINNGADPEVVWNDSSTDKIDFIVQTEPIKKDIKGWTDKLKMIADIAKRNLRETSATLTDELKNYTLSVLTYANGVSTKKPDVPIPYEPIVANVNKNAVDKGIFKIFLNLDEMKSVIEDVAQIQNMAFYKFVNMKNNMWPYKIPFSHTGFLAPEIENYFVIWCKNTLPICSIHEQNTCYKLDAPETYLVDPDNPQPGYTVYDAEIQPVITASYLICEMNKMIIVYVEAKNADAIVYKSFMIFSKESVNVAFKIEATAFLSGYCFGLADSSFKDGSKECVFKGVQVTTNFELKNEGGYIAAKIKDKALSGAYGIDTNFGENLIEVDDSVSLKYGNYDLNYFDDTLWIFNSNSGVFKCVSTKNTCTILTGFKISTLSDGTTKDDETLSTDKTDDRGLYSFGGSGTF